MATHKKAAKKAKPAQRNAARSPSERKKVAPKAAAPPEDRAKQVQLVLARIETGTSENKACEEVGINRATFRAAALKAGAGDQYARALTALAQDQVEKLELCLEDMRANKIDPQQARVEVDARKWFASKFLPKRYGEKLAVGGADDLPPIRQALDLKGLSAEELAQFEALAKKAALAAAV